MLVPPVSLLACDGVWPVGRLRALLGIALSQSLYCGPSLRKVSLFANHYSQSQLGMAILNRPALTRRGGGAADEEICPDPQGRSGTDLV
jgi:hypothetical protein